MDNIRILGTGSYVPPKILTNHDLENLDIDTTDEWIVQRTGIRERRIAEADTVTSDLALEAAALGLQVLFEVHDRKELEKYHESIRFMGVNNRDLKSFRVDTGRSLELLPAMPPGVIPVSESGLSDPDEVRKLQRAGYRLFLMGENFMKERDPGLACKKFMEKL